METNDGQEPSEPIQEDFSVYVAPAIEPSPASDDELIARLEPTIAIVGWPLFGLLLIAAMLYYRTRGWNWSSRYPGFTFLSVEVARILLAAVIGLIVLLLALYFLIAENYYAELYADRLLVRRGKCEWAAPLEEITSIHPVDDASAMPQPISPATWADAFARVLRISSGNYVVSTSFGSLFPIPPFRGSEAFVMRVYQQRAERLKRLPPVVPRTPDTSDNPSAGAEDPDAID